MEDNFKSVSAVIKKLMRDEPYYGMFACGLNKEWTNQLPTAGVAVDGINYKLAINPEFWNELTPDKRYGVLKHELLHLVFYHPVDVDMYLSLADNDRDLLNVAMDMEVQSYIEEPYRYEECDAEKMYKEFPNVPRGLGTKFYITFLKQIKHFDPSQPGSPATQGGNITAGQNILNDTKDKHSTWGDPGEVQKDLMRNQLDYQVKETAKQIMKARGTTPAEIQSTIDRLLKPEPPVFNWKAYFRRLLGIAFDIYQKKTRRKESERFEDSYGLKRKKKHKLLVAIDTSGSVSDDELREFFSEIYHIYKAGADVHILECDAEITNEYDYNGTMPNFVTGRGGTAFTPCVDYYNQHRKDYTTMVYFTDGYGDQDECKPLNKMLWVITSQGNQESKFPGVKICIPKTKKH